MDKIAVSIFIIGLIITGILLWVGRKSIFNIPDYKTPIFGINFWITVPTKGLENVDGVIDRLCKVVILDYPNVELGPLKNKLSILKVKVTDLDDNLFAPSQTMRKESEVPKGTVYKIVGRIIYLLCNGTQRGNGIWVRRLDIDNDILKTAFLHEVIHYVLIETGIDPLGDPTHSQAKFWESGWMKLAE